MSGQMPGAQLASCPAGSPQDIRLPRKVPQSISTKQHNGSIKHPLSRNGQAMTNSSTRSYLYILAMMRCSTEVSAIASTSPSQAAGTVVEGNDEQGPEVHASHLVGSSLRENIGIPFRRLQLITKTSAHLPLRVTNGPKATCLQSINIRDQPLSTSYLDGFSEPTSHLS